MPVHDWTRVDAGIFHVLHVAWIPEIWKVLNGGLLPTGYYALPEQHAGQSIADVLTLHRSEPPIEWPPPLPPATGGIAVADAPPRVRRRESAEESLLARRRTLAIRHISGNRLVAMLEILSPSNKDRKEHVEQFASKAVAALEAGVHLLILDLFPPGSNDPQGIHGVIRQKLGLTDGAYDVPLDEPLTLVAYSAGPRIEAFVEHVAVSAVLPEMPLFLRPDRYINVPLEPTYMAAYAPMPEFLRDVLEGKAANGV
jgi:hypothetical protein